MVVLLRGYTKIAFKNAFFFFFPVSEMRFILFRCKLFFLPLLGSACIASLLLEILTVLKNWLIQVLK